MTKLTEAQLRARKKYNEKTFDRIEIKPKQSENLPARIDAHCIKHGYLKETGQIGTPNRTGFIVKAIETQMKIDNGEIKIVE